MTSFLTIDNTAHWAQIPVLLPFSPHATTSILPAYLGFLLPFVIFDLLFFFYIHSIFMQNVEDDYSHKSFNNVESGGVSYPLPPLPADFSDRKSKRESI